MTTLDICYNIEATQRLGYSVELSALDVQTRREVRQELRRILTDVNITTILVTHQYLEALVFGHQILVLDHGKVVQQGEQRDLLEYPRSSYVAELVSVNFFRGPIVRQESDMLYAIQLQNGARAVEVVAALREQGSTQKTPEIGEEAYIIVDPRSITLYPTPPDSSARNVFSGEIVQILRLGAAPGDGDSQDGRVRVSVLLNDDTAPLTAEVTEASLERMKLHEGQTIYASFKATEASAYT
jgi:molybdate transport system ATP-binding protein